MKVLLLFLSALCLSHLENANARKKAMEDLTLSLKKFSAKLYDTVANVTDRSENIFFSPLSVAETLGMLMAGAGGKTYKEMAKALHVNKKQSNYNKLFKTLYNKIFNTTKLHIKSQVLMANKAFVQNDYPVKPTYIKDIEFYFDAGVDNLDFGNPAAAAAHINGWIEEKTGGMITDMIDSSEINALTRLILANALFFQGQWKDKFRTKGYEKRNFRLHGGKNVRVPFMGRIGKLKYIRDDQTPVKILLPYNRDEAHMLIVMPEEGGLDTFNDDYLQNIFRDFLSPKSESWSFRHNKELIMPLFEMEQTLDMKKILDLMNVRELFDGQRANLTGISDENLSVDSFQHKAKITVNEKGTRAAAVSLVSFLGRSITPPPEQFVIDKPFLFAIFRLEKILFIGRVSNPSKPASSD